MTIYADVGCSHQVTPWDFHALEKESGMMEGISRRGFVGASGLAAGAMAIGSTALADDDTSQQTAPPAWDASVPEQWDREVEALVLGLGIAGSCALVEAFDQGLDVLGVNAAESVIDCSCTRSGGWFCGVGARIQKNDGIKDDVDTFVDDIRRDGGDAGDPDIIRAWGELSGETIDWLQDLGCDVVEKTYDARKDAGSDSHSVARDYVTNPVGSGMGWMEGLDAAITERGIDVMYGTKATRLYRQADGRVVGARVEAMDGSSAQNIRATKGIVMSVGGLGRNLEAHMEYTPSMREVVEKADGVLFSCSVNSLGIGYQMIRDIDGYLFNSPPTQGHTPRLDDENDSCSGCLTFIVAHTAGLIEVNLDGNRFNDETSFEDNYNRKLVLKQPKMSSVFVFDAASMQTDDGKVYLVPMVNKLTDGGSDSLQQADTLEELADACGIPADALVAAVEDYNERVDSGEADEFGRTIFPAKIDTPPFYGAITHVNLGISKGGAKIDANAQVIDTKGNPIPGLYAAGEMAFAQLHGDARTHIVGGPNSSAAVFGRIAARSIANS
jgi:urocanate reductase